MRRCRRKTLRWMCFQGSVFQSSVRVFTSAIRPDLLHYLYLLSVIVSTGRTFRSYDRCVSPYSYCRTVRACFQAHGSRQDGFSVCVRSASLEPAFRFVAGLCIEHHLDSLHFPIYECIHHRLPPFIRRLSCGLTGRSHLAGLPSP